MDAAIPLSFAGVPETRMYEIAVQLLTLENVFIMCIGIAGGIIIGALPGLNSTMGVAIMLPLTFGMESITGMLMLLAVYCGSVYGGSITAILIKTPGTPASAATVLDGYPMAKKGRAGEALSIALTSSLIGGLASCAALIFIAPAMARFALSFGPPEFFALSIFGLAIISSVSSKHLSKGLMMGSLGLMITIIGIDPIEGTTRLTFGSINLMSGISIIPAILGIFAVAEIFVKTRNIHVKTRTSVSLRKAKVSIVGLLKYWKTLIKSSLVGVFIGAVPGTGAALSAFISYNLAKRASKNPDEFGKGCVEGVVAAETANNAVTGATLIPLLTLGIPGDTVTAVLVGALTVQGIIPGPKLFEGDAFWVNSIMIGLIFVNIIMFVQGKVFIKFFSQMTRIPQTLLVAFLTALCTVGVFSANNAVFDIYIMLAFGIVGYWLTRFDFPLPPLVIALVLGPLAEQNMRKSLLIADGDWMIFFSRPISCAFLLISLAVMAFAAYNTVRGKERATRSAETRT
ncbi:MAG: tripartite tricarboxylate transporter permease [Planctomycetaceae bacterium]|nr:tripartite tricarboxylate transporter permease [Planctomycetaceae bacterium]